MSLPILALAGALSFLAPQGDEAAPRGLTVVVVDVGQGSGALILAPDGTLHVFDGGPDGQGSASMLPAIRRLNPTRYGTVFLSHFHADHSGGLDEVLNSAQYPFTRVYDRGDVNRPNNTTTNRYLAAAGSRRRTVAIGQVIPLGGGATATVLCANGQVVGGTTVSFSGRQQEENGRSVALRLQYGDFEMWLGGDLTGGGNGTADVETPAARACGDVDAYLINHHGSNTSTSTNLVSWLAPELALASAGTNNPFGHPTITTVNRLNQAAAARSILATTEGTGAVGIVAANDITISTDGERYRAAAQNGQFLDFFVDEVTNRPASSSDVVISEIQRDPSRVSDSNGEWFEITNIGAAPVSLKNTRIATNSGQFTIFTNLAAYPGRPVLIQRDGVFRRNGGQPIGFVWPFNAISLSNSGDTIRLLRSSLTLDSVAYGSGFPGGRGVSAERRDLTLAGTSSNFAPAVTAYGAGDRGSPGRRNNTDTGCHPAQLAIEVRGNDVVFRTAALSHGGRFGVVGVSLQSGPGFPLLGNQIPIGFDWLFDLVIQLPGFVAALPFEGYRSFDWPLPAVNPISGRTAYATHIVVDLQTALIPKVSSVESFIFP